MTLSSAVAFRNSRPFHPMELILTQLLSVPLGQHHNTPRAHAALLTPFAIQPTQDFLIPSVLKILQQTLSLHLLLCATNALCINANICNGRERRLVFYLSEGARAEYRKKYSYGCLPGSVCDGFIADPGEYHGWLLNNDMQANENSLVYVFLRVQQPWSWLMKLCWISA